MITKIGFAGRGQLGLQALELLLKESNFNIQFIITTHHSSEIGSNPVDFANIAVKHNIPFYYTQDLNHQESLNILAKFDVDYVFAILWINTLKGTTINTAKKSFINIHSGPLPKYRGNACANWAILNGEKEFGVSIHFMKPDELDSGAIIASQRFNIENKNITEVNEIIFEKSIECLEQTIFLMKNQKLIALEQAIQDSSECFPRVPQDGLINWNKTSEEILRLIDATAFPYPGAFTFFSDKRNNQYKLIIYDASLENLKQPIFAVPGQIIIRGDEIYVATGNGIIKIEKAEIDRRNVFDLMHLFDRRSRFTSQNSEPALKNNYVKPISNWESVKLTIMYFIRVIYITRDFQVIKKARTKKILNKEIWDNWLAMKIFCQWRSYSFKEFQKNSKSVKIGYWMEKKQDLVVHRIYVTTNIPILDDDLSPQKLMGEQYFKSLSASTISFRAGIKGNDWAGWNICTNNNLRLHREIYFTIYKNLLKQHQTGVIKKTFFKL